MRGQDGMELGKKFLAEGEAGARSVPWHGTEQIPEKVMFHRAIGIH